MSLHVEVKLSHQDTVTSRDVNQHTTTMEPMDLNNDDDCDDRRCGNEASVSNIISYSVKN